MSRPATRGRLDPARKLAYETVHAVNRSGAYANLELVKRREQAGLSERDAAFVTELVFGTCRAQGTYDAIIEAASGRRISDLQDSVADILRLGCHQLLGMRVPQHAAVSEMVNVAAVVISPRVTGLINAILRKISAHTEAEWQDILTAQADPVTAMALRTHHPAWIVSAYHDVLPADEVEAALQANNEPAAIHLAVRPGLATVAELAPATEAPWSPFGAHLPHGNPTAVPAVAQGRAGVQDEGSQLVALALSRVETPGGPWLDLCAGPGGKAALLTGLAKQSGTWLLANDAQYHRARLVLAALGAYPPPTPVVCADGLHPSWQPGSFAKVMADVPCSGLGALRRRPEARWRKTAATVAELTGLQRALCESALNSTCSGGVTAYVTCSPHRDETTELVASVIGTRDDVALLHAPSYLPEVPNTAVGDCVQLWPHRHGTDAMFLALFRKR